MTVLRKLKRELELVHRHVILLKLIKTRGPIGVRKASRTLNLKPHQVRYSIKVLKTHNLIEQTTRGVKLTTDDLTNLHKDFNELKKLLKKLESELKDL
jgi:predicted transcriptional regulator